MKTWLRSLLLLSLILCSVYGYESSGQKRMVSVRDQIKMNHIILTDSTVRATLETISDSMNRINMDGYFDLQIEIDPNDPETRLIKTTLKPLASHIHNINGLGVFTINDFPVVVRKRIDRDLMYITNEIITVIFFEQIVKDGDDFLGPLHYNIEYPAWIFSYRDGDIKLLREGINFLVD